MIAEGRPFDEAGPFANAAAALATTVVGAQEGLPRRDAVQRLISQATSPAYPVSPIGPIGLMGPIGQRRRYSFPAAETTTSGAFRKRRSCPCTRSRAAPTRSAFGFRAACSSRPRLADASAFSGAPRRALRQGLVVPEPRVLVVQPHRRVEARQGAVVIALPVAAVAHPEDASGLLGVDFVRLGGGNGFSSGGRGCSGRGSPAGGAGVGVGGTKSGGRGSSRRGAASGPTG